MKTEFFAKKRCHSASLRTGSLWAKILFCYTIPVLLLLFVWIFFLSAQTVKSNGTELRQYRQTLNNQIISELDANANALHMQSYVVYNNTNELLTIFSGPLQLGYYAALTDFKASMANYMLLTDQFDGMALLDFDGNLLFFCDRRHTTGSQSSLGEEDWFQRIEQNTGKNNEIFFTRQLLADGTPIAGTCKILYAAPSYQRLGVLVCFSYLSSFLQSMDDSIILDGETISFFGADGTLLYTAGQSMQSISSTLSVCSESNLYGWSVCSSTPFNGFHLSSFIKSTNIAVFLSILLIALVISALVSRHITQPLEQLIGSFKRVETGDFSAKVPIRGNDELTQIARAYNQMLDQIDALTRERYALKLAKTQSELEALQSQINPHFLFNTLNSIKAISDSGQSETAAQMVQALSTLMRYALSHGQYLVRVSSELDILKKYLYLQNYRFVGHYTVTYDIDDDVLGLEIPRLCLQPLVENAIKHGLEPCAEAGRLIITAKQLDGQLYLYIANTGRPISAEKLSELNHKLMEVSQSAAFSSDSVGLLNVCCRLQLHYGDHSHMSISSTEKFTTVKLVLPANVYCPQTDAEIEVQHIYGCNAENPDC